jgi:hypothetical protein
VTSATVQYRVVFGKKDEAVSGPDDAALVITVPAAAAGDDPAASYMRGVLKAAGPSALLFELLHDGTIATEISRLASRP